MICFSEITGFSQATHDSVFWRSEGRYFNHGDSDWNHRDTYFEYSFLDINDKAILPMFDSNNHAPVCGTFTERRVYLLRLPGWAATVASLMAIVATTGCTIEFGHRYRRCCCQHVCAKTSHVSDQYSGLQYSVPQAGTTPISAPLARPAVQAPPVKAKTVVHKPIPVQTVKHRESKAEVLVSDNNLSNLSPKEIDELVDDLFEGSKRKASGLMELPIGECIDFDDPSSDTADEPNANRDETEEPHDLETREVEILDLNLSITTDKSETIVAQLPTTSIPQPLRIACLTDRDEYSGNGQDLQSDGADQNAFSLDPVARLRAIPVHKWDQRHAGVPISENRTRYPRSQLSFVPESCNSLLVLPARSPSLMTPGSLLETTDVRSSGDLPGVEGDSVESHSALPKINEVIR